LDIALVGVPYDGAIEAKSGARQGPRQIRDMSSMMRANHSITLPILRAIAVDHSVGLVHIDAHTDCCDEEMNSKYSHGTPFRRAVEEGILDPKRTIQIGIRGAANSDECWEFGPKHGIRIVYIEEFTKLGIEKVIAEVKRVVGEDPTYVSFDIDSIDPSFAPGTGTPEIGGITTIEAQGLIRGLRGLNLAGADVVEVSPPFDSSGNTALIGATIMYEILCILAERISA